MQQAIIPNAYASFFTGISTPTIVKDSDGRELGLFLPPEFELPAHFTAEDLQERLFNRSGRTIEDVWSALISLPSDIR